MKYIIDLVDDLRENIANAPDYRLLAILLKEDDEKNLQNVGEKAISSLSVNDQEKSLELGFLEEDATTQRLLELLDSLAMSSMMYEVKLKISDAHPLLRVIGFGENHEEKIYTFFVMQ